MTRSLVQHRFTSFSPGWRYRGGDCPRLSEAAEINRSKQHHDARNAPLCPRPPLLRPCWYPWAPSNFGVKLARPGFGPAAELPASSPA